MFPFFDDKIASTETFNNRVIIQTDSSSEDDLEDTEEEVVLIEEMLEFEGNYGICAPKVSHP